MREAIGASWILIIVVAFIVLFSGYLAFSINYSKAYRVKDSIIDILEKYNGPNETAIEEINELMNEQGYGSKGTCKKFYNDENLEYIGVTGDIVEPATPSEGNTFNYCIQKVSSKGTMGQLSSAYYKVVVFFSISLPMSDTFSNFAITGETVSISMPNDQYFLSNN